MCENLLVPYGVSCTISRTVPHSVSHSDIYFEQHIKEYENREKNLGLNGWNHLMVSASVGDTKEIKTLIGQSADVTAVNDVGKNALDIAAENGHAEATALLASQFLGHSNRTNVLCKALLLSIQYNHSKVTECLVLQLSDQNMFKEEIVEIVCLTAFQALLMENIVNWFNSTVSRYHKNYLVQCFKEHSTK